MTVQETIELIKALKEAGAVSFKDGDMELSFVAKPTEVTAIKAPLNIADAPEEIKHKLEEFTSLLKLDDNDIMNRMFPEPTLEEEAIK